MIGLFLACWPFSEMKVQAPIIMWNYLYGLVFFSLFFLFRKKIKPFAPLDFIANISYPIYVTHSIIGYAVIRILMDKGVNYFLALAISFTLIIGLSWLLHMFVETRTMGVGKSYSAETRLIQIKQC